MTPPLGSEERRVLGVLIEKSMTTPDAYPLTLSALCAGCNQKQNRDPVVSYTHQDVRRALTGLCERGAARQAPPVPGARANRYVHRVPEYFHWDRREMAIMAELILRGPQTPGELRSRASRMVSLVDVESVLATLRELSETAATGFVRMLPREPGRSANRWCHLLAGPAGGDDRAQSVDGPLVPGSVPIPNPHPSVPGSCSIPAPPPSTAGASAADPRFERIERALADLERRLASLEERHERCP